MEADSSSLNHVKNVKAKELLNSLTEDLKDKLLHEGICTEDIDEMCVSFFKDEANTFQSKELRKPSVVEIPFQSDGEGRDIYWLFGFLCLLKDRNVGMTPEEHSMYLAYKLILQPDNMSDYERNEIFDDSGRIKDQDVALHYLLWKNDAGRLKEDDKKNLSILLRRVNLCRLSMLDKELKDMGLSLAKLKKSYPEKASLILYKVFRFHEYRYNVTGKYVMYMSLKSFLHIYLRHVSELTVKNQFSERTKFQLAEKDLGVTMEIVLGALNDEYQRYKEKFPNNRFYRKGEMAYYYNGDYYAVDIFPDGQIASFYKIATGESRNPIGSKSK